MFLLRDKNNRVQCVVLENKKEFRTLRTSMTLHKKAWGWEFTLVDSQEYPLEDHFHVDEPYFSDGHETIREAWKQAFGMARDAIRG